MSSLPIIKNSKGEVIRLTAREQKVANYNQRVANSLGYEVQITTLTEIAKLISEQKFFEVPPADYFPIRVGQGAWSSNITTYRTFNIGDAWETGLIDLGGESARLAAVDAGVDALNIKVYNWAKTIYWSIFELEQAARSGNWDLIAA